MPTPILTIDFSSKTMTYRRKHATLRNELLGRAMGLKAHTQPKIIDATAGLARDSFILASLGFEITLLERSPIIHALLEDGLKRAKENSQLTSIIKRLYLLHTDAITWLPHEIQNPDIIYLDPMFPKRTKSALVKKEMRIFHDLIGDDNDAAALLQTALTCALKRVVVKRPRLAKPIEGPQPNFNLCGNSSRFDIYLIQDAHGNPASPI